MVFRQGCWVLLNCIPCSSPDAAAAFPFLTLSPHADCTLHATAMRLIGGCRKA